MTRTSASIALGLAIKQYLDEMLDIYGQDISSGSIHEGDLLDQVSADLARAGIASRRGIMVCTTGDGDTKEGPETLAWGKEAFTISLSWTGRGNRIKCTRHRSQRALLSSLSRDTAGQWTLRPNEENPNPCSLLSKKREDEFVACVANLLLSMNTPKATSARTRIRL